VNRGSHADVVPRPAATVVLLRPGRDGAEVLLTRRPSTMAFGADLHVFPGGAVDAEDAARAGTDDPWRVARFAAAREAREEAGIELDPDALVALSLWSTPPIMPRRFSTRFFVAQLPAGAVPVFSPDEVVDHVWLTPAAALEAMGDGVIQLWIPTSSTLVQLEGVRVIADVRDRYASPPIEHLSPPRTIVDHVRDGVWRVVAPAAGGIPGRQAVGHLAGRQRFVLVDHGDPSEDAANAALEVIDAAAGELEAIVLTSSHPDQAGGAEALALRLDIPVLAPRGEGRRLPHDVEEFDELTSVRYGDVRLDIIEAAG
jgi:8-oxo-dGTP pyrophosphatase MutT (NUDIX family)